MSRPMGGQARSLRSGFLLQAAERPQAVALRLGDRLVSYGEMEEAGRRLASAALSRLGRPPRRVGVLGHRSACALGGPIAALLCGATYVPLNPTFPLERTREMARRAGLDALVADAGAAAIAAAVLEGIDPAPLLLLPESPASDAGAVRGPTADREALRAEAPLGELPPIDPAAAAYLLFTSGSTGRPKGVAVSHLSALHFLDAMRARLDPGPSDRFSQTHDQTFDLSLFDTFLAWECGASTSVFTPLELLAPGAIIRRDELTVWLSVPSLVAHARRRRLLAPGAFPSLRWSLFCGEPLPRASAAAWAEAAPDSVVENLYGPTEATVACLAHRYDPAEPEDATGFVPIGSPLPGTELVVADAHGRALPPGAAGELLLAGPQLALGYWRDEALTRERFPTLDPDGRGPRRCYRTGDRVVARGDGVHVFLGRDDQQVKILGHRTELGEIEASLLAEPGVTQAAAFGWPVEDGSAAGVIAFVCGVGLSAETLVAAARSRLPAHAVPRRLEVLPEMPLNANGKIDRAALRRRLAVGA